MEQHNNAIASNGKPPAKRRLKLLILCLGILIVISAIGMGTISATSTPQFCSSCHEMQPEYATWQVSSHQTVTCIQCHVEPGLVNLVKDKTKALAQVYQHLTDSYPQPIELKHPIKNEVCEQCHTVATIEPRNGLIVSHEKHIAQEIDCMQCHLGVVHGQIAARGLISNKDFEVWTTELAQTEVKTEYRLASMESCQSCHQQRQAPNNCSTCHETVAIPADHQAPSWNNNHGKTITANDLSACNQCHTAAGPPEQYLADYTRANTFCSACHQARPEGHQPNWIISHPVEARSTGIEGCLTCHELEAKPPDQIFTPTYCNQCHQFKT